MLPGAVADGPVSTRCAKDSGRRGMRGHAVSLFASSHFGDTACSASRVLHRFFRAQQRLVWFSCCSYCDKETPDREHDSGCFVVDLAWEPKGLDFGQETVELISSAPRRRQSEFAVA